MDKFNNDRGIEWNETDIKASLTNPVYKCYNATNCKA